MYNKEEQMIKVIPFIKPMLQKLESKGITWSNPESRELENIVFTNTKNKKEAKIAHKCFYRESGICKIRQEDGENKFTFVEVTDEMFYNTFMKTWIEMLLV